MMMSPQQKFSSTCWSLKTHKKFIFQCDCGQQKITSLKNMADCLFASCGKCNHKSKEYWLAQTWGKLKLDPNQEFLQSEWSAGSNQKLNFICNCDRKVQLATNSVTRKNYTSCGHCDDKAKEYWFQQKWGILKINKNQSLPLEWGPMSQIKIIMDCECGNTANIRMCRLSLGTQTTCGKCNVHPKEYWLKQRWGSLVLDKNQDFPDAWSLHSGIKLYYLCDCGRKEKISNHDIGQSCGKCTWKSKEYWLSQRWDKVIIDPNQKLPDEFGSGFKYIKCICDCGNKLILYLGHLVHGGESISCGCARKGMGANSPARKIAQYIQTIISHEVNISDWETLKNRELDIWIPSKKLAIEHHGLIWHSEKFKYGMDKDGGNKLYADRKKFLLCRDKGIRLIQIYGDEWENKQEIMKRLLASLLQPKSGKRIKPIFEVQYAITNEAIDFLNQHHYLGSAGGCVNVVARYAGAIVGVWVFQKREIGTVLWHRAAWNHDFKAWNPHEKALKLAIPILKNMGFTRILTFADNRFHSGGLYEKLGFKFEEEIKPNYYYTDGRDRKTKYAFRVKAGHDERAEAEAKGWYRIYDSGKIRYSFPLIDDYQLTSFEQQLCRIP